MKSKITIIWLWNVQFILKIAETNVAKSGLFHAFILLKSKTVNVKHCPHYFKIQSTSLDGLTTIVLSKNKLKQPAMLYKFVKIFLYRIHLNIVYNKSGHKNVNNFEYFFPHRVQEKISMFYAAVTLYCDQASVCIVTGKESKRQAKRIKVSKN